MYFRANQNAFKCLKHEVCSLRNPFIDPLLKISYIKNCEDSLLGGKKKSPKMKRKLKKRKEYQLILLAVIKFELYQKGQDQVII